jgi:hypothetical protein
MSKLFFSVVFLMCSAYAYAQTAGASTDKKRIRLGEELQLKLETEVPKGKSLIWPEIKDTLGEVFEVLGRQKPDTSIVEANGYLHIEQIYQITSFDSGIFNLPAFPFQFANKGDTDLVLANPIEISVLTVPVDTTKAIQDIRGIADVPFDIGEYMPWILGGVVLLALLTGFIYWYLRRKKPVLEQKPVKKTEPWKLALSELDRIEKEAVWRQGKVKQYYSDLSETVRRYLEDQSGIPALESTSDEILHMMRTRTMPAESQESARTLFKTTDLVKFAKTIPDEAMHATALMLSRRVVETTRPRDLASSEGENGKEAGSE